MQMDLQMPDGNSRRGRPQRVSVIGVCHAWSVASLESEIVEWSVSRPMWHVAVLRRLAKGEVLDADDFAEIADRLASGGSWEELALEAGEMPGSNSGRGQVALRRVKVTQGVWGSETPSPQVMQRFCTR